MSTHIHTRAVVVNGQQVHGIETLTVQGGGQIEKIPIANGVTDQLLPCAIDVSQLVSLVILSSVIMLLETNSASAPTNTITTKAGVPYIWTSPGSYDTCKITADVTTNVFVTNASGAAGDFEMYWGYGDVTP